MTALMKIQTFIHAYVRAISSILESDVTVVDSELIRVAGTGNYAEEIGSTVAHGNFFSRILLSGEKGIITDAAKDENCIGCEKRGYCKELANLAYPIFKDGAVVGVISIIAFQEEQREYLLKNRSKLEEFLKYMCVLLESKLYTDEANDRLEQQLKIIHNAEKAWSFVGQSPKMQEAIRIGKKVAKSNSTVFLRGESGTGKEIMAKMIHALSDRRDALMISINCAAIPENLVESELFGYEEGAFTGAKKHGSIGKFELADKSTIFLDEIGDMPLHVQTKLLRVLQENKVERIGGRKPIPIDIRVICATNKNIEQMVEEGTFREDLYYRLNIIPIELPPLRKRKEDLPALIDYYIAYYNHQHAVGHAVAGKQIVGYGEHQHPADEVGERGDRLHGLPERHALDLIQKDSEDHRQPGGEDRQAAHGEGIAHDQQRLLQPDRIVHQVLEPLQPLEIIEGKGPGRTVIEKSINPSVKRIIGKHCHQNQEGQYIEELSVGPQFLLVVHHTFLPPKAGHAFVCFR